MNTHELIESTMLHALGLLDDAEREAYEAAFQVAPADVQAGVRKEAQRMADLGDLTTDVEPTAELRTMVLAAVRAAVREDENDVRIASERAVPSPVIGRIDANTQPAMATRSTSQPKLSSSPRVHRAWRVASISFAAASIAFGVVVVYMQQSFDEAQSIALSSNLYDSVGAKYYKSYLYDGNTQRITLASTSDSPAMASVWSNPDWDSVHLHVNNLSSQNNEPYRLVVLDADGNIAREITTFTSNGEDQVFDIEVNIATDRKLAIYPAMIEDIQNATPLLVSSEGEL